mmetsp:Transcript_3490/g.9568  ORF Transcript_3490/g.9568 Transcript_3490/m.9568 type:complete len:212 (-) Transcript_3490:356-991(-)
MSRMSLVMMGCVKDTRFIESVIISLFPVKRCAVYSAVCSIHLRMSPPNSVWLWFRCRGRHCLRTSTTVSLIERNSRLPSWFSRGSSTSCTVSGVPRCSSCFCSRVHSAYSARRCLTYSEAARSCSVSNLSRGMFLFGRSVVLSSATIVISEDAVSTKARVCFCCLYATTRTTSEDAPTCTRRPSTRTRSVWQMGMRRWTWSNETVATIPPT